MPAVLIPENELIEVGRLSVLIFGPPGAGKTSLAQTTEQPLTLDFDRGIHRSAFRKAAMRFDTWCDLGEATAHIPLYKTLVPDTAGRLLDLLSADIIRNNAKHGSAAGGLTLQGYGVLKARFALWQGQLQLMGKDIVFVAHEKEERDVDERIMRPDLQGASYTELMKACDLVGYLSLDGHGQRWLDFNPSDRHLGKNAAGWQRMRVPNLAEAPTFLADLLTDAKHKIGATSAASAAVAQAVDTWTAWLDTDPTLDAVHAKLPEIGGLTNGTKRQVWHLITGRMTAAGYQWDKVAKRFVPEGGAA